MEPGNRDEEQVAVRHADASGGNIIGEEELDKLRKRVRFERDASSSSAAASSDPTVTLEYPASGETQRSAGVRRSC